MQSSTVRDIHEDIQYCKLLQDVHEHANCVVEYMRRMQHQYQHRNVLEAHQLQKVILTEPVVEFSVYWHAINWKQQINKKFSSVYYDANSGVPLIVVRSNVCIDEEEAEFVITLVFGTVLNKL